MKVEVPEFVITKLVVQDLSESQIVDFVEAIQNLNLCGDYTSSQLADYYVKELGKTKQAAKDRLMSRISVYNKTMSKLKEEK